MNRRMIVLVGFGVLVPIVLLYLWMALSPDSVTTPEAASSGAPIPEEKRERLAQGYAALEKAKKEGDETGVSSAFTEIAEALGGRAGKMVDMAASRNVPIRMYGRVIDQHGEGVAGARVLLVVSGGGTYAPGSGRVTYTTNETGLFQVDARGQAFSIIDVQHPNLAAFHALNPASGAKSKAIDLDAAGQYGQENSWRSYPSPDAPYLVRVTRVDAFERLETFEGNFTPRPNGEGYEWGGVRMTCEREEKVAGLHWRQQKGSWAITLHPVNGGIQETADFYLDEAPEEGYRSELAVAMKRGQPDYDVRTRAPKFFYYFSEKGGKRIYGALEVIFNPYIEDDVCEVRVDGKLSPSGSRNLAREH